MYLWFYGFDFPERMCTRDSMMEEDEGGAGTFTATDTVLLSITEKSLNSDCRGSCMDEAIERETKSTDQKKWK